MIGHGQSCKFTTNPDVQLWLKVFRRGLLAYTLKHPDSVCHFEPQTTFLNLSFTWSGIGIEFQKTISHEQLHNTCKQQTDTKTKHYDLIIVFIYLYTIKCHMSVCILYTFIDPKKFTHHNYVKKNNDTVTPHLWNSI